ncbi:MAG: DNA topology modulation protein, partial [Cephaloticoccus sp.]
MQRIIIIGCGGAGKSTLARELGARLGLPVHHLDRLFWRSGWVPTPRDEWAQIQTQLCAAPAWIIEGNYGGTMDIRLAACDTVIFLDYARHVCVWRMLRRWWQYRDRSRPDMTEGCPERLNFEFFLWIWRFRRRSRPRIEGKLVGLAPTKT